jgi:NADPH-dependent F420 reductase
MACIAFVGGTGSYGRGLALRFALAGEEVIIGSRSLGRAEHAADRVRDRLAHGVPSGLVRAADNLSAVHAAEIVVLTVPFPALESVLADVGGQLAGKTVFDVVNPVEFVDGVPRLCAVREGSAAGFIQARVPAAQIVCGFKNISAHDLWHTEMPLRGDVLLCGDVPEAKERLADVVRRMPDLRPVDAGPLEMACYLESVTALLLNLNQRYHKLTSIQILGL